MTGGEEYDIPELEGEEIDEIEGGSLEILPLKSWTTVWYQEENLKQQVWTAR